MAKHQLSQAAHARLSAELADLTTRGRIEVADKIERARLLGDLKENGDYHAAKDEQGHMEGRIRQVESILEDAEIVPPAADGVVGLGSVVTIIYNGDSDDDAERYLIGHVEERPVADDISVMSPSSPLGSALLGATAGDSVTYEAPNGKLTVKVLGASAN
jgi:transcription elongation factor GreA